VRRWLAKVLQGPIAERSGQEGTETAASIDFPLTGFTGEHLVTKYVDHLSDDDLRQLNTILPWKCFTLDANGRRFGDRAWSGKRESPQVIPDPRIVRLNERFGLRDKEVLEVGCFEGIHTIALCAMAKDVTAIDSRIENVIKTIVRTALFGARPAVFKCDVEAAEDATLLAPVDVVHHVGVLYHLRDPVKHLLFLGSIARHGVMLDTHFAMPEQATERYDVDGREFAYKRYGEGGRSDVFSGMYDHAKWLTLRDIRCLLTDASLPRIDIVEERMERNGPRVLLFASKR
jgi:hypothetical protein